MSIELGSNALYKGIAHEVLAVGVNQVAVKNIQTEKEYVVKLAELRELPSEGDVANLISTKDEALLHFMEKLLSTGRVSDDYMLEIPVNKVHEIFKKLTTGDEIGKLAMDSSVVTH